MRVRGSRRPGTPTASFLSELLRLHRDSRPPQIAHCSTLRGADYTPEPGDKSYGSHGTSRGKALRVMELREDCGNCADLGHLLAVSSQLSAFRRNADLVEVSEPWNLRESKRL